MPASSKSPVRGRERASGPAPSLFAVDGAAAGLIAAAVDRTGYVLRPFPEVPPDELDNALALLRGLGLIHGPLREPNLTRDGIDQARALVAELCR
jgi:hypothetical protein